MMKKKYTLIWCLLLCGITLTSCREDDLPTPQPGPAEKATQTLFLYMAGDNNLSVNSYDNIASLAAGTPARLLADNRVVIYQDPRSAGGSSNTLLPKLWELAVQTNGEVVARLVKEYEEQNSGDSKNLSERIEEVTRLYPADRYGLLLWSHGTGWLPADPVFTRAFGQDVDGSWMEINELAAAIPSGQFDYILFDACYMGTVEVAYALRQKADYIVASPAEIISKGFPYEKLGTLLLGSAEADLEGLCDAFYDKYIAEADTSYRSVTLSLVKTSELDNLASVCQEVLRGKEHQVYAINTDNNPYASHLQYFDRITSLLRDHTHYDLADFLQQPGIATSEQYGRFEEVMSRAVPYYRHTKVMFYEDLFGWFYINRYSGLSTYIPRREHTTLNAFYQTLAWYKAVYQ